MIHKLSFFNLWNRLGKLLTYTGLSFRGLSVFWLSEEVLSCMVVNLGISTLGSGLLRNLFNCVNGRSLKMSLKIRTRRMSVVGYLMGSIGQLALTTSRAYQTFGFELGTLKRRTKIPSDRLYASENEE